MTRWSIALCLVLAWLSSGIVQAQDADPTVPPPDAVVASDSNLARAEAAYLDIDFEGVREAANAALREGGHDVREVVRIYQMIGMSNAALGDPNAARDAFVRMLILDDSATVDELSPELRGPYLEARGRVGALSQRFEVRTVLSRPQSAILVRLTDPLRLASRVVLHSRVSGEGEFQDLDVAAAPEVAQRLEGLADAGWAEYALEVRDEHGNRLALDGDLSAPKIIGEPISRVSESAREESLFESPWFWTIAGAVLVGAGVGAYFLFFNEPSWVGQSQVCFDSGCAVR